MELNATTYYPNTNNSVLVEVHDGNTMSHGACNSQKRKLWRSALKRASERHPPLISEMAECAADVHV